MTDQTLIYFGGDVKALGGGKVGGYVLRFGTPDTADIQGDFFAKDGDYGLDISTKARIVYHHGLTKAYGARRFGVANLSVTDEGIWGEGTINEPNIYADIVAGKIGWSSGSVDRLTSRKEVKGKSQITSWPLIEVSLTPHPVDRRNRAIAIKALSSVHYSEPTDVCGHRNNESSHIHQITEQGPVARPSLLDRSARLVADATELYALYLDAANQRRSEGRLLSPSKRAECKALAECLGRLASTPPTNISPEKLKALRLRLLKDRIQKPTRKGNQP